MEKNPLGKINEWQRLFRVPGLRFFIDDIWMEHYQTLGALTTVIGDVYTSYLPRTVVKQTMEDGARLIADEERFKEYESEFRTYMKKYNTLTASFNVETCSKEETKTLLDATAHLFYFYSKTEFFYTDGAYQRFEETKETKLKRQLDRMGQLKYDGREFLNRIFFGADALLSKLLEALAKRFNIPERALQQYAREEIYKLFDGVRIPDEAIRDRDEAFYILGRDGKRIVKTGKAAREDIESFLGDISQTESNAVSGTPANTGRVKGRARVIVSGYDNFDALHRFMDAMDKGDILIAETTSPELMPACRKAGGIITDQGGMLSHAAIVSRELNIPCIVGTGNATERIKEGDIIELDGVKGEVRIIERAQRG
jgi:phosphohistidine swiveling domain-containing protein